MKRANFVHRSICSLVNLARRDGVPVKGRPIPWPPGDLRWIQPSIRVGISEVHVGVGRLARDEDF